MIDRSINVLYTCLLYTSMEKFRKGVYTTVTVVDHDLKFVGTLGEKEILDAVVTWGPQTTLQHALDS